MPADKKSFDKLNKAACKLMCKKSKDRKECIKLSNCTYDKCNAELEEYQKSVLTDEERAECKTINKDKPMEHYKCIEDLKKIKDYPNKNARLRHCNANKCPEISDFAFEKLKKNMNEKMKDECVDKHCMKESNEYDRANLMMVKDQENCNKKYKTYDQQSKCSRKASNKLLKPLKALGNCKKTKCAKANNHKS